MSTDSKAFLKNLSAVADWMKAHSPAEVAEAVGKMTPEDRVRFLAYMHVMKANLRELMDSLPAED